jgi:hypothetical protein
MGHLPFQRLLGSPVIGDIGEENGFGYQVIGGHLQDLMRFGSLAIGNQEDRVGSGAKGIGNIVNRVSSLKFQVAS